MSKQTAVEWLVKELNQKIDFIPMDKWDIIRDIVKQAKAMHKEEIVNAVDGYPLDKRHLDGKEYYKQTYGGNNESQ